MQAQESPNDLIRIPAVIARCGRSKAAIYAAIHRGEWTKPIRLGVRCSAWPVGEVDALNAAAIRGATPEQVRALVQLMHEARATAGQLPEPGEYCRDSEKGQS